MKRIQLRYLATAFLECPPSYRIVKTLTGEDWDPFKLEEVNVLDALAKQNAKRPGLVDHNSEDHILFLPDRIDAARTLNVKNGGRFGDLSAFVRNVATNTAKALKMLDRKCHRMALVNDYLVTEMTSEELGRLYDSLNKWKCSSEVPFEWEFRAAHKISRDLHASKMPTNALTNTLVYVQRQDITLQQQGRDPISHKGNCVRLMFDINTQLSGDDFPEEIYDSFDVETFFTKAVEWHAELLTSFTTLVGVKLDSVEGL